MGDYDPTRNADEEHALTVAPDALMPLTHTPASFAAALANERAKRNALEEYIRSGLKRGTDYDRVGPGKKDTLLKPGAEKVAALLQLRAAFVKDTETMEMLPERDGTLAYVCHLLTRDGEIAAEGRGACEPSERPHVNVRVKIAMKRAMVDAVLRVAALSDYFTQDLDDLPADFGGASSPPPRQSSPPRPSGPKPGEEWVPDGCRLVHAQRPGECGVCGNPVSKGQLILYSSRTYAADHEQCAKREILGDGPPPQREPGDEPDDDDGIPF